MTHTVVAFQAHPDDEALLTAGTMARAAAAGHRVVMVVATDGDPGGAGGLGAIRLAETRRSAGVLGVARVEHLGYADSGLGPGRAGRAAFVSAPVGEAAERLAAILREERADVLLSNDRNGGYGHRDHIRVHEVGALAVRLAGTARCLQATIPRETVRWAVGLASRFGPFDAGELDRAYSARSDITHRIPVHRYVSRKRASLRAHASQTAAKGGADRTLAALLRIPRPVYDLVAGWEWFIDPDHRGPVSRDIFAGLP
ncbi:PIG-L family deacetylase [Asanoa sp. NPDC049573]|uniref:PIG-L deacetylase family protein n=1 Tax=Asanoa sp. NPDC049573 TaxID=3155396 RepID=UPI00343DFE2F